MQQVHIYSVIKSGDLVGHGTGPPLSTVGLSQVTLRAMQQVRTFVIKNITNATVERDKSIY